MQMGNGRTGLAGITDRFGALVRLGGQRGVVSLGRDRTGRGDGENEAYV